MQISIPDAVANVLAGHTADGASQLLRPLSFTANRSVRHLFAEIVAQIVALLRDAGADLSSSECTALIFKLAAHCSRCGWQSPQSMQNLEALAPTLVDAISEKRDALCARTNVNGILRAHAARALQRAAHIANVLPPGDAPTVIAYAADEAYSLVELTTPAHLMAESAALGHCVGTLFVGGMLWAKGLSKDDPEAAQYLLYAVKMQMKELRIFSLRHNGRPCATIAYNIAWRRIDQIEGRPRRITGAEPFFPALCELLHVLASMIDIGRIRGIPVIPPSKVLTRHGQVVHFDEPAAIDILAGAVIDARGLPVDQLRALASRRRLTLSVGKDEIPRLPPRVLANLVTGVDDFVAPQLEHASSIYACEAQRFVVPGLKVAGTIEVHKAKQFEAPHLQRCDYLDAQGATRVALPSLERAGSLVLHDVPEISLPALTTVTSDISATGAKVFTAPHLQRASNLYLNSLNHLDLPQLRFARDIYIKAARRFWLPVLESAGNIYAGVVARFDTPRLRRAAYVHAIHATHFIAPQLRNVELVHASQAEHVDAPNARGRLRDVSPPPL